MNQESDCVSSYLGLAPFLRRSLAGEDLMPLAQALWVEAAENQNSANAWMNLSIVLECVGQAQNAQHAQNVALSLSRVFVKEALRSPVSMRVLLLKLPGNLSVNTPLDCLFEEDDVEIVEYFLDPKKNDFALKDLPPHDVLMVGFSNAIQGEEWAKKIETVLKESKAPVVNSVSSVFNTRRDRVSLLMQNVEKALMPLQILCAREEVATFAFGEKTLPEGLNFPLLIRLQHSQGGKNLEKIESGAQLADYLNRVDSPSYFLSSFVDYQSADGFYRKMRVAVIAGKAYAVHLAVSSNWMIHYLNAHMEKEAKFRKEEREWMASFEDFAQKYENIWQTLHEKTGLDYCCMDCALLPDERLLIFEFDHVSVVHDMDDRLRFPYKSSAIARVKDALRDFLFSV